MNNEHVELLSPAGDYKCFEAAMDAGADAVYLGLTRFSARAKASNFTVEELNKAIDKAHILGRKIYLTVNTLLRDDELDNLYYMLYQPYINGLDGVIVQDTGVITKIKEMFIDLPIHVSTQAAVTGSSGALYLKELGAVRIVPARELSLDEISRMKKLSGLEIECFIHGSLCYSYSGKCLMSSFIGGRSGNRGRCAQPCRLPYDNTYPLSLKDLCTIDLIPDLIGAGVSSFKIEGRLKSSSYVYGVTSIYRKYIDSYYRGDGYHVDPQDRTKLVSYYTRGGNCSGYYRTYNSRDMITIDSPSYQTSTDESPEDTVKASTAINIKCSIKKDKNSVITVSGNGYSAETVTDIVPQISLKHPLSADEACASLCKTGGTPFVVKAITAEVDEGLFLPKRKLNEIRRLGLDAFTAGILSGYKRDPAKCFDTKPISSGQNTQHEDKNPVPDVRVFVLNADQARAAGSSGADALIVPMSLYSSLSAEFSHTAKKIYVSLPYVIRNEKRIRDFIRDHDVAGYYVSNFEALYILKELSFNGEIVADMHMYAYNKKAYEHFRDRGIRTTVPVELNRHELIRRGIFGEEMIIYGKLPMMISANCVYNTKTGCRSVRGGHDLYITDRKSERFFVHCDCDECTNVIYNSVPLSAADEDSLFARLRPSSVRFMFTDERDDMVSDMIGSYLSGRNSNGSINTKPSGRYTKGHLNRGVE